MFDPTTAQALPARPGAMAVQPRPRGSVTAGRPLPPRPGEVATVASAAALAASAGITTSPATAAAAPAVTSPPPPVAASAAPPVSPAPALVVPAPAAPMAADHAPGPPPAPTAASVAFARPARPDARPMRIALGAGAVAAVSALTIGLVKPDFGDSATDTLNGAAEPNAVSGAEVDRRDPSRRGARVRRVTRYILLEPGEKAPRGATVISAEARDRKQPPARAAGRGSDDATARDRARDRSSSPRAAAPKPEPKPPAPPRVTTRQSGG